MTKDNEATAREIRRALFEKTVDASIALFDRALYDGPTLDEGSRTYLTDFPQYAALQHAAIDARVAELAGDHEAVFRRELKSWESPAEILDPQFGEWAKAKKGDRGVAVVLVDAETLAVAVGEHRARHPQWIEDYGDDAAAAERAAGVENREPWRIPATGGDEAERPSGTPAATPTKQKPDPLVPRVKTTVLGRQIRTRALQHAIAPDPRLAKICFVLGIVGSHVTALRRSETGRDDGQANPAIADLAATVLGGLIEILTARGENPDCRSLPWEGRGRDEIELKVLNHVEALKPADLDALVAFLVGQLVYTPATIYVSGGKEQMLGDSPIVTAIAELANAGDHINAVFQIDEDFLGTLTRPQLADLLIEIDLEQNETDRADEFDALSRLPGAKLRSAILDSPGVERHVPRIIRFGLAADLAAPIRKTAPAGKGKAKRAAGRRKAATPAAKRAPAKGARAKKAAKKAAKK